MIEIVKITLGVILAIYIVICIINLVVCGVVFSHASIKIKNKVKDNPEKYVFSKLSIKENGLNFIAFLIITVAPIYHLLAFCCVVNCLSDLQRVFERGLENDYGRKWNVE